MSLESWKEEFYPIPAKAVSKERAVQHSLTKWIGLRKENLVKHSLRLYKSQIAAEDFKGDYLGIDLESCALCQIAIKENPDEEARKNGFPECKICPLYKTLGGTPCDGDYDDDVESTYSYFTVLGNPEPMIAALERTLENQKEGN